MVNHDPLFDLIKSLSAKEKRNFSSYALRQDRSKEPGFWKLYQVMLNEEDYNEKKIIHKLKGEKMVRQLSVAKNYLSELILQSLTTLYRRSTVEKEIREGLNRLEVLAVKGQGELLRKVLQKTWKLAHQFEYSTYQLELLNWFLRQERKAQSKYLSVRIQEYANIQKQVVRQIVAESQLRLFHDELFAIFQAGTFTIGGPNYHRMLEIMESEEVRDHEALTFHAKVVRQYLFVFKGLLLNDANGIELAYRDMVALWKAYPHQIDSRPAQYFTMLFSHCDSCFESGVFVNYEDSLSQLKLLKNNDNVNASKVFYMSYHLDLRYFVHHRDYQAAEEMISQFESESADYQSDWNSALNLTFYYNILQTLFLNGNYQKANKWAQEIINAPIIDARKDIQNSARLFQLILHFQLDNIELLENLLKSTERYLSREREMRASEKAILEAFRTIVRHPDKEKSTFKKLLIAMEDNEDALLGADNILVWVNKRIS